MWDRAIKMCNSLEASLYICGQRRGETLFIHGPLHPGFATQRASFSSGFGHKETVHCGSFFPALPESFMTASFSYLVY